MKCRKQKTLQHTATVTNCIRTAMCWMNCIRKHRCPIGRWTRRVGAAGTLVGAVMFGFSIKDNNAVGKVAALKTFAAGAIVVSVSGILHTFI